MPVEMFLRMDGVTGESRNYQHKGWSDVLSWTWAFSSNRRLVRGDDHDNASFNEISLIKRIGRDSMDIMRIFAAREIVPHVEFNVLPVVSKKEAKQKYLHFYLEDVIVKSIVTGGSNEEDMFKERITLIFDRVRLEYNQHDAMHPDLAAVDYVFGWDVRANSALQS